MDEVHERNKPRYLDQGKQDEDWPVGPPSEIVSGAFLVGAFVLCLDFWLLGVLAIGWLRS